MVKSIIEKSTTPYNTKTWILRLCFVASLLAAAAICGVIAYSAIENLESDVGKETYKSIAATALTNAKAYTTRQVQATHTMSSIVSNAFPYYEQWPYVALPNYRETASLIATLSSTLSLSINPIVYPHQAVEFEEFAKEIYKEQEYYTDQDGIWSKDNTTTNDESSFHDITGETDYGSKYELMVPVFLHNKQNASSLLFNIHRGEFRGRALDSSIDCVSVKERDSDSDSDNDSSITECGVMSDFLELIIRPGPAAMYWHPIYPAKNRTGTGTGTSDINIVGFIGASINWQDALTNIVPSYVDGLHCVISSTFNNKQSFTFIIHNGVPQLLGEGDLHDTNFAKYGHSVILNEMNSPANASQTYTLTVYPTTDMFDQFSTNSPLKISLGFVAVILFCSLVFFLYDFFMRYESRQRQTVLEMKRRFVRFVSHEIRTPLNTVCLGLELLKGEMEDRLHKLNNDNNNEQQQQGKTIIEEPPQERAPTQNHSPSTSSHGGIAETVYWLDMTTDILENSENAVMILNDLLNYDKIETGTFKLEFGQVKILDLIEKTVSGFDIQAKRKNVELNYQDLENDASNNNNNKDAVAIIGDIESCNSSNDNNNTNNCKCIQPELRVIGDDVRLRQVIRNLISNALKFIPENDGRIDVKVKHNVNGLPNATIPSLDSNNNNNDNKTNHTTTTKSQNQQQRAGSILIQVKDNGVGMRKDQLDLLFCEGVQFDANKLQHGGGSGLGLCISKGLLQRHGGNIVAESKGLGTGSTFTIELPVITVPSECKGDKTLSTADISISAMASTQNIPLEVSVIPKEKGIRHVLVVDDALMNRKMLIRLLEREGHICTSATNGIDAIQAYDIDQEKIQEDNDNNNNQDEEAGAYVPIDCILMDYEMPIMNGPNATKKLREKGCKAHIIGVTGNVLADDVTYFKSVGADAVLPKPVNMTLLQECWDKLDKQQQYK